MSISAKGLCPSCGRQMPTDSPGGLCPECWMKAGFETGAAPEPGEPTQSSIFAPPSIPELGRLFPQLEIVELLGHGGMGAVYKARQPALDRWIALKVLPPQSVAKPGFAERFNREARALARLNHPGIVAVHEFGQVDGLPFLILEYVDGVTLRRLVQERRLAPNEALQVVPQICEALQFAHDAGIVHRDIKPENILLDKKGRVKIADFGIAKILDQPAPAGHLTGNQAVIGTPHYMAPEQVEKPQSVDHRADIYSLGVVFYEMLTGELPLGRFVPPSHKVEVDVRLDEVVLRALEKEPERRYQQASQMRTAVQTITSSQEPPSARKRPPEGETVAAARNHVQMPALGLLVTGLLNLVLSLVAPLFINLLMRLLGLHPRSPAVYLLLAVPGLLGAIAICYGSLRMLRLTGFGWAVAASILAMIIPPGLVIGLPLGIWALIMLSRPEVRAGFVRVAEGRLHRAAISPAGRWWLAGTTAATLLAAIVFWFARPDASHPPGVVVQTSSPVSAKNAVSQPGALPMLKGPFSLQVDRETMQSIVSALRQQYPIRLCLENLDFDPEKDGVTLGRELRELEQAARTGPLLPAESNRLALARKLLAEGKPASMLFDIGECYQVRIIADAMEALLARLTEGTAYTWGKVENTFVLRPRNGSKLAYAVTLNTERMTVEQAIEAILQQQPAGSHIGLAMTMAMPVQDGVDPMPWLRANALPLTLSAVSALEALCRVTADANPDSVWELAGMSGARSLGLLRGPSRPEPDPQATGVTDSAGVHPMFQPPLALGSAFERAIQLRSESDPGSALDLDSGRVVKLPVGSEHWPAHQRRSWLYEQHLELAAAWEVDRWCLLATDVTLKALSAHGRASPGIAQPRYALASGKDSDGSPAEVVIVPEAFVRLQLRRGLELPCAFAFQTAAGQLGFLELVSTAKDTHTVHVRCRLVQNSVQEEMSLKER